MDTIKDILITDTTFAHLTHLIKYQDDVIRASGAPSETKLKVPHMVLEIGEFLAGNFY